jgi:hypothetical protein
VAPKSSKVVASATQPVHRLHELPNGAFEQPDNPELGTVERRVPSSAVPRAAAAWLYASTTSST